MAVEINAPPFGGHNPEKAPVVHIGVERFYSTLQSRLAGFEKRKEQYELTAAIAGCLENKTHLAAQAPTGTGKSFAVGGAIIAAFHGKGKRAIIATANNSLLEQYASKDLPFLQSMFPDMTWARAKGKNNYACIDKGEKVFGQQTLFDQSNGLKRLREWYETTQTGDKEEITFNVLEMDWNKINADDSCTGRKCPFYSECHYYRAKSEVQKAEIIVTNFDLLLLDLFNPEIEIFPAYDALILDEAHQLEEKAISKLEQSLTEHQVLGYINKAKTEYGVKDPTFLAGITEPVAALFRAYRGLLVAGKEKESIIPSQELIDLTEDFQRAMGNLSNEIWQFKTAEGSRERKAQDNLMSRCVGAGLAAMAAVTNTPKTVSWVEQTKTDIKVVTCPYIVAGNLYQSLFSNPEISVICLSATLGIKGKKPQLTATNAGVQPVAMFDQFRTRVGMVLAGEFDCPSPFSYSQNCVLYIPTPPPAVAQQKGTPKGVEYQLWMQDQILQLVNLSRGRALILTTSNQALKEISGFLARECVFPVKAQSPEMPNSKLIEWFKSTDNAVLVGTSSFWEGISIEGDDLKLVIIDKIPFPNNREPIHQARENRYRTTPALVNKAFTDLSIYPAVIRLLQGFGRLIRTKSDTGAVAILDPRLTTAHYKGTFLNSFPKAYRTSLIQDQRLVEILR